MARVKWLRDFITGPLGFKPDFEMEEARVQRFIGVEEIAPGFHAPKGLSQGPASPFFIRTVGDPRPGHELPVQQEQDPQGPMVDIVAGEEVFKVAVNMDGCFQACNLRYIILRTG